VDVPTFLTPENRWGNLTKEDFPLTEEIKKKNQHHHVMSPKTGVGWKRKREKAFSGTDFGLKNTNSKTKWTKRGYAQKRDGGLK